MVGNCEDDEKLVGVCWTEDEGAKEVPPPYVGAGPCLTSEEVVSRVLGLSSKGSLSPFTGAVELSKPLKRSSQSWFDEVVGACAVWVVLVEKGAATVEEPKAESKLLDG